MLVQFSVSNFLSFKERVTLSMVAAPIKEFRESNTFVMHRDIELTKGAVIYGANASGKSNLFQAMFWMETFVRQSVEKNQEGRIPWVRNFKLSDQTDKRPSLFEIVILLDSALYRYGFEVSDTQVVNEWLYRQEKQKEEELFLRTNCRDITFNKLRFGEGEDLASKTRDNALFLTVAAQFNGAVSNLIVKWFLKKFYVLSALEEDQFSIHTRRRALKDNNFRQLVGGLLQAADFGIKNIVVSKTDSSEQITWPADFPQELRDRITDERSIQVSTVHPKYNEKNTVIGQQQFNLFGEESEGTRRFFCMMGPVFRALLTGGVLVVDELDSSLHSRLVWRIARLFNSKETNPNNAQLIFTTHDTTVMSQPLLRRDQMWFVEKDRFGASKLYSLADYDIPIRNDASFEKDYLKGKYGAVPSISSELESLVVSALSRQKELSG